MMTTLLRVVMMALVLSLVLTNYVVRGFSPVSTRFAEVSNHHHHHNHHRLSNKAKRSFLVVGTGLTLKRDIISPGSELFLSNGPYIPSGLTAEEYKAIKDEENAKLAKMNFGAWGPRFKRSDVPIGDWMVIPSLWTNGVNPRPRQRSINLEDDEKNWRMVMQIGRRFISSLSTFYTKYGPSFLMAYIAVDMLATAISLCRATATVAQVVTVQQSIWIAAKLALLRQRSLFVTTLFWKMQTVKILFASTLTPMAREYLERVNRRKLWSIRRTIIVTTCAGMGLLMVLAGGILKLASRV